MNPATKAVDDDIWALYDDADEQERLRVILEPRYTAMLVAVHQLVASAFPEVEDFRLDDPATRRMLADAGNRIVRINETTREAIREQLRLGQQRGYSAWELANGVPKDNYRGIEGLFRETWKNRPLTVARTELQEAQRLSALDRYQATGLVQGVLAHDGGTADSDEFCASRNGRTYPLANAPTLAHPNCTLSLVPVLREEKP